MQDRDTYVPNLVSLALIVSEILELKKGTEGRGYIDSVVDADQEYIYFKGSAMPPSACYAHFFAQT